MTVTPHAAAMNPTKFNIEAIAKLEHEALERRTLTQVSPAGTHSFGCDLQISPSPLEMHRKDL